ncbi:hypothetical protein ASPZODRAFT_134196 [Penicilliopsis zonata CBS 506.65]|uniref:Dol-P-Man:Man(5)GlcNAc(2)-PP-Dol alpha-1,3-mannosyltransferase n=1 Tax=Penicilliopsis zonata CBS 506.65 TaxID=1073090 RepID=A0A1L9SE78_9EURO|nr:hypothetical protein ASPZODRAFT_134196 [Penicilliopsis zonata CBS 506.65]OJJ45516.1 hypothetical protein ASPZODRAFT_134196 [Penicilliopsis zonata CBS 506.65]
MTKLSPSLKALINAPFARPNTVAAPRNIQSVYQKIKQGAEAKNVSQSSWLVLSSAATMTMNSPESLATLFQDVTSTQTPDESVATAELMREVGIKCISFNGIPRSINCLNAFRASLPEAVANRLSRTPTRSPTVENLGDRLAGGRALWDSVYRPFENKLYDKLAESHPDLPVVILSGHYGITLSDPPKRTTGANIGRVQSSLVAIACLRAQSGVGPQVLSHVFGLRKALDDGSWAKDVESEAAVRWLASDEGSTWILESVDSIVKSIGEEQGSNFAPASKL